MDGVSAPPPAFLPPALRVASFSDVSARGLSPQPQGPPVLLEGGLWFLLTHACLWRLGSASFPLSAEVRRDQSKWKGWKTNLRGGTNTCLATPENLLKCPYESLTLWGTLSDSSKDRRWEKKEKKKKPLHWKFTWKKQGNMGLSQAAAQHPLLLLCWAVLIILYSSGSFQVIALKIPYLQWLKIISSFLFTDLPLHLYDLPFPNISQVFKNNNLSVFLPSLIWLVYIALFNWVHADS